MPMENQPFMKKEKKRFHVVCEKSIYDDFKLYCHKQGKSINSCINQVIENIVNLNNQFKENEERRKKEN